MDWRFALFVVGTVALVGFVGLNAYLTADLLRRVRLPYNPLLHPTELVARFGFIAACLGLGWLSRLSPAQLGWSEPSLLVDLAVGLGAAAVLQEINHQGTAWAIKVWGRQIYSPTILQAILPRDRNQWIMAPLALLPAALAEELLFRSLVVGGFSVFASPWLLALAFSAAFGLAHLPQGRLGVAGAAILGFFLSLLFIWRWSIVACTVAHFGVNFVQLVRARDEERWLAQSPGAEASPGTGSPE